MPLNLKIFKICIMHEFTPQMAKICKHARKKYGYLELISDRIFAKFENCKKACIKDAFA